MSSLIADDEYIDFQYNALELEDTENASRVNDAQGKEFDGWRGGRNQSTAY